MARRVLITGARAAAALDLARDFAAAGWEAHLADSSGARMARLSRAPASVHRYAPPALRRADFRRDMTALIKRIAPELVIPICEEVFHLAAWAEESRPAAMLLAPPLTTLRMLHDKLGFAEICAAHGLPVPESAPYNPDQPPADPREFVFKSRFTRFGEGLLVGPTSARLERQRQMMRQGWMTQRLVRGSEVSFYAVACEGNVLAFSAYKSDWRLPGGASFAFTPVAENLAKSLRDIAGKLAEAVALTGQFSCDAIVDEDGKPWLIECNPRATSGVHLLTGHGDLANAIASGERMAERPLAGCHALPVMLAYGLPMALRRGALRAWFSTLRDGHDAIGRRGDRRPVIGALADGLAFTLQGWRYDISAPAASTRDIEWNGEDLG